MLALVGACTGNPDVVIDVTTAGGASVDVFSCPTGSPVNIDDCHDHVLAANEHTVGIFTDAKTFSVAWQVVVSGANYCQQVELDLSHGTIDIDYLAAATAAAAMVTHCAPSEACMPAAVCR